MTSSAYWAIEVLSPTGNELAVFLVLTRRLQRTGVAQGDIAIFRLMFDADPADLQAQAEVIGRPGARPTNTPNALGLPARRKPVGQARLACRDCLCSQASAYLKADFLPLFVWQDQIDMLLGNVRLA